MSTEHDDPGHGPGQRYPAASLRPRGRDRDDLLAVWARMIGAILLQQNGVPKAVVDEIVEGALASYWIFRGSVANRCAFLANRIRAKGREYMDTHGIVPAADPETLVPHLLDVARIQAAFQLLQEKERKTLQILFEEKNRSFRDVADELDVSVGFAERLAKKALNELRRWIAMTWPRK